MSACLVVGVLLFGLVAQYGEKEGLERANELIVNGQYNDAEYLLRGLKSPLAKTRRALLISKDAEVIRASGFTKFDPDLAAQLVKESLPSLLREARTDGACAGALAGLYRAGLGVEADEQESFGWLQKAAAMGYAPAIRRLAAAYMFGDGVPKDPQNAFQMFKRAADLGDSEALVSLATCYYQGRGVKQDEAKAEEFIQKAAEAGNIGAMQNCADLAFKKFNAALEDKDVVMCLKHFATFKKWLKEESDRG